MKRISLPTILKTHRRSLAIALFLTFAFLISASANAAYAQKTQLSLADILIALRSKKATLPDRNKILTDAVNTRGTTFTVTPEIEKELFGTGADKSLIDSIRQRSQIAKISAVKFSAVMPPPTDTKPRAEPVAASAQPDFAFYVKRADANGLKGDFDAALADYTKGIEMNAADAGALLSRGTLYFNKGSFTLAIADYTKAIETSPQDTAAYAHRAEAYEKKGNNDLAVADYKKVLEIESTNETAKTSLARLQPEPPKVVENPQPKPEPVQAAPVIPEFVNMGLLSEAQATRMVKPIYSPIAYKSNIGGKVVVEVEFDKEGNVTSTKVISGHPYLKQSSEDAARKCKFKPVMVGNQAVKAKGIITYNFVAAH